MKSLAVLIVLSSLLAGCVVAEPGPPPPRSGPYADRDRDGIPNRADRDRDGDGVANRYDRYPGSPRSY